MNLMNLIRSLGFLALGWTVLALGIGALGNWTPSPPAVNYYVLKPSLHQVITLGKPSWRSAEQVRLVDQVTGKTEPVRLPTDQIWALLTVAPWRDQDGNLEVVGRWARHLDPPGERPFSGLGRFRLSDATVVSRIPMDVIPTGRPCLFSDQLGEILFPTGDGQLYRCNVSGNSQDDADSSLPSEQDDEFASASVARRVSWQCAQPGVGQVIMSDPFWSPERSLRNYVFVSLSLQIRVDEKIRQEPQTLWWLRMNDRFDRIEAAGPLNHLVANGSAIESRSERFPTIAADAGGKLTLVYLHRQRPWELSWRLHSARLELNPKTGEPSFVPNEKPPGASTEVLTADPPLISADGKLAFARTIKGELATIKLVDDR